MPQAILTSRFDTSATRAWLQQKLDSIRAAQNHLQFQVTNVARDEAAIRYNRPEQAIFYYDAVDNGRVGFDVFEFETRSFSRDNMLHFKTSATKWVVTRSVGPSTPRRITVEAIAEIRDSVLRMIDRAIGGRIGRQPVPDGAQLVQFVAAVEQEVLRIFELETFKKTRLYNTKLEFYGVISTPLSEGFRIVRGGPLPR